jgi:opacity protein-like surface antigen
MSKFKVSEPDLLDDAFDHSFGGSKSNTPFSIAIGKEISKNNSGDWLLEFSLMTGEKYEGSLKESYAYTDYWGDTYSESYSIALEVKMTMALFASMYYQFNVPSVAGLKPYLGAGLGLASIKASLSDTYCESDPYYGNDCDSDTLGDASGTNLAYQLALGADYFFNKNVALGLGWGYRNYGSVKIDYGRRNDKVDLSSSGLFGKLTYRF